MFNIFTLAIKFDCLFLAGFQSIYWFVSFIFDKLAPQMYVSKDALNHFLVHSRKKNSLWSATNEVFSLFCILIHWPIGAAGAVASLPGFATEKHNDLFVALKGNIHSWLRFLKCFITAGKLFYLDSLKCLYCNSSSQLV